MFWKWRYILVHVFEVEILVHVLSEVSEGVCTKFTLK